MKIRKELPGQDQLSLRRFQLQRLKSKRIIALDYYINEILTNDIDVLDLTLAEMDAKPTFRPVNLRRSRKALQFIHACRIAVMQEADDFLLQCAY